MGRIRATLAAGVAVFAFAAALSSCAAAQGQGPSIPFRTHAVVDAQQGNLTIATLQVPVQWRVSQSVQWRYADVSHPVRAFVRAEAPDGSAWIEFFPAEMFFWLDPAPANVAVGNRSLGMIHAPNVNARQAVQQFVVSAYRGQQPSLRVGNVRPVDPGRLAAAFGEPPTPGEAVGMRLTYVANGRPVEEDVYGLLGSVNRIPYTGRQGTSYENHRVMIYAHALGANAGTLDSMYPLLTYIVGSLRIDPGWIAHRQKVMQALAQEFQRAQQAGYAQIDAAGAASRAVSAGNDAMLSSMQSARAAQQQRDASQRAAAAQARGPNDGFSQYLRGTERMKDPYWGESERSSLQRYHWTDGSGNYRSSNDASFNPNIGTGGGVNWQRMEPAR
jgi:hypothetical protein